MNADEQFFLSEFIRVAQTLGRLINNIILLFYLPYSKTASNFSSDKISIIEMNPTSTIVSFYLYKTYKISSNLCMLCKTLDCRAQLSKK